MSETAKRERERLRLLRDQIAKQAEQAARQRRANYWRSIIG